MGTINTKAVEVKRFLADDLNCLFIFLELRCLARNGAGGEASYKC
jgi:hypothetical protein